MLGKEPDFLQSDGTDHVYDNTVSSVSWSFPGLELNVNELQARIGPLRREYSTNLFRYQGSLGSEGLQGEVRLSRRPHVTFWWFTVRCDEDGEGGECRSVSIDKERKQNAVNFKRDFLLRAAEEILRFRVNDQVQARVGGRREMDGGRVSHKKRALPTAGEQRAEPTAGGKDKKKRITDLKSRSLVKSWKDAEQEQAAS